MANATENSWKNRLQEYCQKNKLGLPNYRIRQQPDVPTKVKFQVEVEVNGRWYIGEENCLSKKAAEHSAAQKACADLMRDNSELNVREHTRPDSAVNDTDLSKHMPREYADIEDYIAAMVGAFGGQIRKVRAPDVRGRYRLEIAGNYRYCENIQAHHKKNQVYFLVDPVKKVYYRKCYDRACQGFQTAGKPIYTNPSGINQQESNFSSAKS